MSDYDLFGFTVQHPEKKKQQTGWKVSWVKCNRTITVHFALNEKDKAEYMAGNNSGTVIPLYGEEGSHD
jgi:beta-lactamase class D